MAFKDVNKLVTSLSIGSKSHEPYSLRRVKGASPEYIAKANKDYEDVIPFLKESGYNLDNANTALFEKYMDDLFAKIDNDEELQGFYNRGKYEEGNNLYNERYGKLYNALDKGWDKFATDEYVEKAPYGYEDD